MFTLKTMGMDSAIFQVEQYSISVYLFIECNKELVQNPRSHSFLCQVCFYFSVFNLEFDMAWLEHICYLPLLRGWGAQ